MRKFLLLGSLFAVSISASANDAVKYTCKMGNAERVIEVVYASADKPVPCTVSYTKALSLLTAARTMQVAENFDACYNNAKKARKYISDSYKGQ